MKKNFQKKFSKSFFEKKILKKNFQKKIFQKKILKKNFQKKFSKKILKKNFQKKIFQKKISKKIRKRFGDDEYLSEKNRVIDDCIKRGKMYTEIREYLQE